jgi:hypothetical protein
VAEKIPLERLGSFRKNNRVRHIWSCSRSFSWIENGRNRTEKMEY